MIKSFLHFRLAIVLASLESGYLEKGNDDWQSVSFMRRPVRLLTALENRGEHGTGVSS